MRKPVIFERGDSIYLVAPLAPMEPSDEQIEEYAFAEAIKKARTAAPNPHIGWFAGHYVEADNPNANGAMWSSGELAIKKLTPMFMPVTVMHDPRTAVGLIADVALKTPETDQVPRAKIETALALWKHRFPEAYEEALHNYKQGSLMQSMECFAPDYSCSVCGMTYHKLPGGEERDNWCDHLKESNPTAGYVAGAKPGESQTAVRILRNVCFTGTGLIYGSRGAKGADSGAYLESFQEEVAEFHQEQHQRSKSPKRRPRKKLMETVEIAKTEYEALLRAKTERDSAVKRAEESEEALDAHKQRADKAESDLATKTTEAKDATERAEAAEKKVTDAEESARKTTLASERMDKLGKGFVAKLGENTKKNLREDAAALTDEKWAARLDEVAELVGVKPDAAGDKTETEGDETVFSREEVAASRAATTTEGESETASDEGRRNVVGGLFKQATGQDKAAA